LLQNFYSNSANTLPTNQIGKSFTELELHNAAGYIKLLKSNKIEYDKIKLNLKHLSELHTNKNASVIINKYA